MASGIYNSAIDDGVRALIDYDSDTFKVMLVGSGYTFDKDAHLKRSAVTANEVAATGGYSAGGQAVTVTVTKDTANDRVDIVAAQVTWNSSTITAYGAVYYKSRGGADTADELVAYNDFGGAVATTNGTFTLPAYTLRLTNT